MKRALFLLLTFAFSFSSFAAPNGKRLYEQHCSVCHNEAGLGGIGLPLDRSKVANFSRDYLFSTIRVGREGRIMPAFDALSDVQVNAIIDHIESWNNTPKTLIYSKKPILGNRVKGKKLYQQKCSLCHGDEGKSPGKGTGLTLSREREFEIIPPALNNQGFLASASDAFIKHSIITGFPDSEMPSLSELKMNDDDLNDVVSYIRSFEKTAPVETETESASPTLIFDSPYDFTTTVKNLKETLKGSNFRYFPDRFLEQGLTEQKNLNKKQLSVRFCNFNELYKMINIDPRLGALLPCRITVIEKDNGKVQLVVMNMTLISSIFNNDQLTEGAKLMHETMLEIIDEVTL